MTNSFKAVAANAIEALSAIVESVSGTILSFFGKGAGVNMDGLDCFCCQACWGIIDGKS